MAGGLTALGISLFAFSPSSCYTACEFCRPAGKYELGNNRESMRVAYKYEGETVGNFKTSLTGIILAGLLLSACTSSGSGPGKVEDTLGVDPNQQAGQQQSGQQTAGMPEDEIQDPRMYCPNITLRAGTETHDVYPDGVKKEDEGAASKLRYRATITETVRDCASANGFTNIEVGVAGRFLSGPQAPLATSPCQSALRWFAATRFFIRNCTRFLRQFRRAARTAPSHSSTRRSPYRHPGSATSSSMSALTKDPTAPPDQAVSI